MESTMDKLLFARHYLLEDGAQIDKAKSAYYNAYLLANFGVVVNHPELLSEGMVKIISGEFKLNVPASFYANPQDTKYYTRHELLVEQLVSYLAVETVGYYDRIKLYAKDLPEYKVGDELKLREFQIVTMDEATKILCGVADSYCAYTRPFGLQEQAEFEWLFENGYYKGTEIKCRENVFALLRKNVKFARFLDKKDLVKLSVSMFGDCKKFDYKKANSGTDLELIKECYPLVHDCPLTKKQAKYYNKIGSLCGVKANVATNANSPYKLAEAKMRAGDVYGAAQIYAHNGSLLQRNIKYLLSRANPIEAGKILDLIPAKNPIVLYQMVSTLSEDKEGPRTFAFSKNNRMKRHIETDYESTWRKSKLNDSTKKLLHDLVGQKVKDAFAAMPSIGKSYVSDEFYKIGIPSNTSTGGKGIDVVPTGSRLPCRYDNIRTFVYWKDAFDIDSSLILVKDNGDVSTIGFYNYAAKPFGLSIMFSGDCRAAAGSEYYDLKLSELKAKGYKYVIQAFNGFASNLNEGEIFCGYQNKENLATRAWDPKNIEFQFQVKGDSRACIAFAFDLEKNEVVMLNMIRDADNLVLSPEDLKGVTRYMSDSSLEFNCGLVADLRSEYSAVKPEDATIVFSNTYAPKEGQTVVRTWELEKLVALVNGGKLNA